MPNYAVLMSPPLVDTRGRGCYVQPEKGDNRFRAMENAEKSLPQMRALWAFDASELREIASDLERMP